jgi:hypothetical protein
MARSCRCCLRRLPVSGHQRSGQRRRHRRRAKRTLGRDGQNHLRGTTAFRFCGKRPSSHLSGTWPRSRRPGRNGVQCAMGSVQRSRLWSTSPPTKALDCGQRQQSAGGGQTLPEGTTPTGRTPDGRKQTVCLERYAMQVQSGRWPTPTASLGTKGGRVTPRKGSGGGTLIEAVSLRTWATPTVKGNYNRKGASKKAGDGLATQVGGQLNPRWVEWLMGWPIGWTSLQPLETDKFQQWLDAHGRH